MTKPLTNDHLAEQLKQELQHRSLRLVLAESCTAGLIAATLGRIPGISEWLAGSAVVYQLATKVAWLKVSEASLADPGPVSQNVSEQMAVGVLQMTPHAEISVSVTGHLGPDAPDEQDGMAWTTVAMRRGGSIHVLSRQLTLDSEDDGQPLCAENGAARRCQRQQRAVHGVFRFCLQCLRNEWASDNSESPS